MKITYLPGCDDEWRAKLTPWQTRELAALHRQGRGLRDRTDHGADKRWRQAGVKTRESGHYGGRWRRTERNDPRAHERVLVQPRDFGYTLLFVRRASFFTIDPETGEMSEITGWKTVDTWHVGRQNSANFERLLREKEEV